MTSQIRALTTPAEVDAATVDVILTEAMKQIRKEARTASRTMRRNSELELFEDQHYQIATPNSETHITEYVHMHRPKAKRKAKDPLLTQLMIEARDCYERMQVDEE